MAPASRATVRSCRWPGATSETQIGMPSGRMTAWTFPPGGAVLAGVPRVGRLALDAGGGLGAAVGADQLAVDHDVRPALLGNLLQGLVQVGGLGGEHGEGL